MYRERERERDVICVGYNLEIDKIAQASSNQSVEMEIRLGLVSFIAPKKRNPYLGQLLQYPKKKQGIQTQLNFLSLLSSLSNTHRRNLELNDAT